EGAGLPPRETSVPPACPFGFGTGDSPKWTEQSARIFPRAPSTPPCRSASTDLSAGRSGRSPGCSMKTTMWNPRAFTVSPWFTAAEDCMLRWIEHLVLFITLGGSAFRQESAHYRLLGDRFFERQQYEAAAREYERAGILAVGREEVFLRFRAALAHY